MLPIASRSSKSIRAATRRTRALAPNLLPRMEADRRCHPARALLRSALLAPGTKLTLILRGRGRAYTQAEHFADWTLLLHGPAGKAALCGPLSSAQRQPIWGFRKFADSIPTKRLDVLGAVTQRPMAAEPPRHRSCRRANSIADVQCQIGESQFCCLPDIPQPSSPTRAGLC